jgi:hypothetical protein
MQAGYMVVRIWHDGRVEDVAGPTDRQAALSLARTQARIERTVYLRAPDDVPLDRATGDSHPTRHRYHHHPARSSDRQVG